MQYKSFFLSLVCLGAVVQAQAELKVIGDFGGKVQSVFMKHYNRTNQWFKLTLTVFLQH